MSDFMQQALQLNPKATPPWLADHAEDARKIWQAAAMPTRKTEAWKYTRLRPLETGNYFNPALPGAPATELADNFAIADLNAQRLVYIDGVFQSALSAVDFPQGVELVRFADADSKQSNLIRTHLSSLIKRDKHIFAALNDSWLADGLFLHVGKNIQLKQPVEVLWLTTRQDQPFSLAQRLLVVLEDNAQATLVEQFGSSSEQQNSFTNGVTELILGAGAQLDHYRLHLEQEHSIHIGGVHAGLGRNAQLNSFHLALGSMLKRLDVVINFQGEGAHCDLNGVYLPHREQHVDFHTCMEHAVPNCTSNEIFRGIIGDSAQAVFNGRIHIHRNAQKTSARLSNKNLLTSNKAEVNTKPELEIYADDVQCAHGATVAQIDEQLLYYFLTRGISRQDAETMLSFGFINELLSQVKHAAIGNYLRPLLARHFAEDPQLARHIA